MGVVPVQRLDECFIKAYREKKQGEFFEPAAICQVWYRERALGRRDTACHFCASYARDTTLPACPFHMKEVLPL